MFHLDPSALFLLPTVVLMANAFSTPTHCWVPHRDVENPHSNIVSVERPSSGHVRRLIFVIGDIKRIVIYVVKTEVYFVIHNNGLVLWFSVHFSQAKKVNNKSYTYIAP